MALQTGKNMAVVFKAESVFNTAPGATGARQFRPTPSPGLALGRAEIASNEVRSDGLTGMARLGSSSVTGSYSGELSVRTFDELLEACMRGTWAAEVAITESAMTSITTTTDTIVAAAGSWITQGVRVGDIVRLTNHATTENNNKNLPVLSLTGSTITVPANSLTLNASPDTAFTLTVLRKLKNGAVPTRRSFYFEEVNQDLDKSEVFGGCRVTAIRISGQPDAFATIEVTLVGASGEALESGSSPYYTSPTLTTSIGLVMTDASIRLGGVAITTLTSFELSMDLGGAGLPVVGSTVTPDVFENSLKVSGSLSMVRENLDNLNRLKNETELELSILLVEPEAEPKGCISIFVPRLKVGSPTKQLGGEGALIETMPWFAGKKEGATGYDDSMLTICTDSTP